MKLSKWSLLITLSLFAVACSPFAPETEKPKVKSIPEKYSLYSESPDRNSPWWHAFNSRELNELMEKALKDGFTLKQAKARLLQSRFAMVKSGALQWPSASLTASQGSTTTGVNSSGTTTTTQTDSVSLGATLSYELDIWGERYSTKNYQKYAYKASGEDLRAAAATVAGQVVEIWTNLISTRQQIELLNEQKKLYYALLEIIQQRFQQAQSTAMDVYQQEQSVLSIEQSIIGLRAVEAQYKHALALLLGLPPKSELALKEKHFPKLVATPPTGLPADLLAARPDVRAAGLRLKSAEWQIAAAKADRLPSLSLSASYTYSSTDQATLFDNWITNLAANLTGPIFDAGYRKAEVERVKQISEERLENYKEKVLTAIKEVEDALVNEALYAKNTDILAKQTDLSEKILREAQSRYLEGNLDFSNVVTQELGLINYQQNLIKSRANRVIARAGLYKALGSHWADEMGKEAFEGDEPEKTDKQPAKN